MNIKAPLTAKEYVSVGISDVCSMETGDTGYASKNTNVPKDIV